jgi:flagellar FliL protein
MATTETNTNFAAIAPVAKVSLMTMLLCCAASVVLAVGVATGVLVYLMRSGKLSASPVAVVQKTPEVSLHAKPLDPLLINLADEGGHAYLRLSLVLEEENQPGKKTEDAAENAKPVPGADASVRDTIFDVLGRQTSTAMLAPDGKEILKSDLLAEISQRDPELRVKKIYFTDFLVQR